jgi:uncharacterized transporter YbjL
MKKSASNIAQLYSIAISILGVFASISLAIYFGKSLSLTTSGLTTTRDLERSIIIFVVGIVITFIISISLYCIGEIVYRLHRIEMAAGSILKEVTNERITDNYSNEDFDQTISNLTAEEKSRD